MQMFVGLARPAAGRCKEGHDALATEVLGLQERVDDIGLDIPPNGESEEHNIILCEVVHLVLDGWTAIGVSFHLLIHTRVVISPVHVGIGIGLLCLNLEDVCTYTGRITNLREDPFCFSYKDGDNWVNICLTRFF